MHYMLHTCLSSTYYCTVLNAIYLSPALSPKLDADLAYYTNGHWLHRISMFTCGEERERELFITRVSAVIKTVAFR
jgi:hypothetical protein